MIAPWIVGSPVWGYGAHAGTVLRAAEDPHEYMPGVWVHVMWNDGFVCWTSADSLDAMNVSFS